MNGRAFFQQSPPLSRRRHLTWGLGFIGALFACASEPSFKPSASSLPPQLVLQIGEIGLPRTLFEFLGQAEAPLLHSLERDILFSLELTRLSPDGRAVVERAALARQLLQELRAEMLQTHPPTADELEEQRKREWLQVDRPRAVRVADIFIPVPPLSPDGPAWELAEKFHEAVRAASSFHEFTLALDSVDRAGLPVETVVRPPVAADGRIVPFEERDREPFFFEEESVAAIAELREAGELTPIVAVQEGFHLYYALEVYPEHRLEEEELAARLSSSVAAARAAKQLQAVQGRLRKNTQVQLAPQHAQWTRLAWKER